MLAVERRDGRSLSEVEFPMEQNELEEGEALSDHRDDDDAGVNPDTDFAYLDDKVRQYLGHFQKDFEGCVSAENLGSRYGAYGSFLPSYQRSPSILARPRSPPLPQSSNTQRTNNLQLENGRRLNLLPVNELLSRKRTPPLPNAVSTVPNLVDNVQKTETVINKAPCVGENSPKHEFLKKASSGTDQKTLKVRIKMGPENALARKNAAIYSGLGLDISPSSSVEDSHGGSVQLSPNLSGVAAESPKTVIQMMSSFMNSEEKFNSPLQESLLYLQEKVSLFQKKSRREKCDASDLRYHEPKHGEKKRKANYGSDTTSCLNVDGDIDTMESKEPAFNALKLPRLMEPKSVSGRLNSITTIRELSKESSFLDAKQELELNAVFGTHRSNGLLPTRGKGNIRETKGSSILEDKKAGARKYMNLDQRMEGQISDVGSAVRDFVKGVNDESVAFDVPLKKVVAQDPVIIPPGKEDLYPSKMKMKGSQSSGTESIEPSQEISMPVTVVQSKEKKKGLQTRDVPYETKGSHGKHLKELSKVGREFHQDAFEDLRAEVESGADLATNFDSLVEPKVQRLEEKDTLVSSEKSKDKSNSRKHGNISELESRSKIPTQNVVPGTVESSEAGALLVAPAVVIKEHWVGCDRCEKWRLLPLDLDPDILPKKWHCSMITWLPGMNKCSISQDETTKAVQAFYHIPVPESLSLPNQREEGMALESASESVLIHQQCHDPNSNPISIGKRKKQTSSNDIVNAPSRFTPITASHAVKKSQQGVVKSKNINDVNHSAEHNLANGPTNMSNFQTSFTPEMAQFDEGERHDGKGKQSKNKSRRESEHDSRKMKTEDSEFANDGWLSGRESSEKLHTDNGLSAKSGRTTALGLILREQKDDATSVLTSSRKKEKTGAAEEYNIQAPEMNKSNSADLTLKKRKIEDRREGSQPETADDANYDKADMSESDKRNGKKMKMFKSKGSQNKEDCADEERKSAGNLEIEKRNYDTVDSRRKDSRYKIDSSMAATSSSSKISGSRKNKSNIKDLKGSPVESVSSSPLRGGYASEKITVSLRSASREKVDTANVELSDDEEGAFGLSGNAKKGKESLPIRACNGVSKGAESLSLDNTPLQKKVDATKSGTCPLDEENAILDDKHNNGNVPVSEYISGGICREKRKDQEDYDLKSSSKYDNGASEHKIGRDSTSTFHKRRKNQIDDDKPNSFSERGNCSKGGDLSPCREKSRNKANNKSKNSVLKDSPANFTNENMKYNSQRVNDNANFAASAPMSKGNVDNVANGMSISQRSPMRMHGEKLTAYQKEVRPERSASKGKPIHPGKKQDLQRHSLPQGGPSRSKDCKSGVVASASNTELQKQQRKTDSHAAVHSNLPRHLTSNATAGRDFYVPSPARKDHSQLGSNALKEAKDLKHKADNMQKLGGLEFESVNMYFQAALKFLYGASLLEHGHTESAKNGESTQSMQIYTQTAGLCEYCAHEYERQKDMAAACLAYKCMEMAYMRVTYIKNFCATKDRAELQAALNSAPRGGSPSSSASDVDNANNQATIDKAGAIKPLCSGPASNLVSVACNRSNFIRLLNFTQDINFALEALSKSQIAFAAANTNVENSTYGHEGISSVRKVLDFNVHDVGGMLHLIRVAMESISR